MLLKCEVVSTRHIDHLFHYCYEGD